jgi:tetratricopeptide (TPR) repeat protein
MTRVFWALMVAAALHADRLPERFRSTDERIAAFERRLQRAPEDAQARDELAGAFLQKMRETADGAYLERAAKLVNQSLKTDPANHAARRRQIEIAMQRHEFQNAAALTEGLAKERHEDSLVWGLLGDAQMELGNYEAAADAYQTMADLRPSLGSYSRVAYYRFVTGDAEGALEIMRKGIEIGSPASEHVAWCLADLGNMLFKTGRIADAEQSHRQALALVPGYHHALGGLARVLAAQGRMEEATQAALRAQAAAPLPEYAGLLAKLYRKQGKQQHAAKQIALLDVMDRLEQAAGAGANRNLALALTDLDHRTGRALELAKAELAVRGDVYTYDALAWALFRNGQVEAAAAAMEKALRQGTPEPSFHHHAARILEALGRGEAARQQRERAALYGPFELN